MTKGPSLWAGVAGAGALIGLVLPGPVAASGLTGPATTDPVSLGRILAVFALGCILALLAALVIARRGGVMARGFSGPFSFKGLLQPMQQGSLAYLGRQALGDGFVAHHLTLNDGHWLVVTGPGGVCASPAPSTPAGPLLGKDDGASAVGSSSGEA